MKEFEKELIKEFERISESIGAYFCSKYFNSLDYDWVANNIGGILNINDYFFSLEDMLNFMKYKYTKKQMFKYYDYALEERTKSKYPVCIRDWKKLK